MRTIQVKIGFKLTTDQRNAERIIRGLTELLKLPKASCGENETLGKFLLLADESILLEGETEDGQPT